VAKNPSFHFPTGKIGQIMYGDNLIPKRICEGLIDESSRYFDRLFKPGITISGSNPLVKSSSDFNFSKKMIDEVGVDSSNFAFYENEVSVGLYSAIAHYIQEYEELWNWPGVQDTGYRMQRYFRNHGYYRAHVDGNPWESISDDEKPRVLGVIIYLNDVEVGGSTYFPSHDVHVPAKAGRISVFPTNWTHPHMGQVPITSDKWIISTFMTADIYDRTPAQEPETYAKDNESSETDGS